MNMTLTLKDRAALIIATETAMERINAARGRHEAPFAKTVKGKTRRDDRRNARAAKSSFLNSRD